MASKTDRATTERTRAMSSMEHQTDRDTIVGVFHSHAEAQRAVRELKAAGFNDDQIGLVSKDSGGTYRDQTEGNMAAEGAAAGAIGGLGAGALWGLGIVAGVLPAIGPVIAGGALAAVAASAAGTAAAGGLIGALVGLGVPEKEAEYYESEFNRGRIIVTLKTGGADGRQLTDAHRILDDSNAYDYYRRESEYATNPNAAQRVDATGKMVARKEVLDVDKHTEVAGEARVRKEVTSDIKHVEVPVKREELVVERTGLKGQPASPISGNESGEERITLREEEVDVNKRTVGKESVNVGKRTVQSSETVAADLKEENIVVDKSDKSTPEERR